MIMSLTLRRLAKSVAAAMVPMALVMHHKA